MFYDELNNYILNYLQNDKTGRAIMINGRWGTGKSHYIKYTLKPFIEENKLKCVIVSLYGITNINEISKNIYWGLRTIWSCEKNEVVETAKVAGRIIGKTLFNGISSFIGYEIATDPGSFQKVYESIDLTNVLVIIDDFERSKIDITELLGYINNLCEQDGVKILIVSNETELIKLVDNPNSAGKEAEKEYTEETKKYLKIKEKTISDTILFYCDLENAIQSIIKLYHDTLAKYEREDIVRDIAEAFSIIFVNNNLRLFIDACQKTSDLINISIKNGIRYDEVVTDCIFYSIIGFSRYNRIIPPPFPKNFIVSTELGSGRQYPLFKCCYDYLVFQNFDIEKFKKLNNAYYDYTMYEKTSINNDESFLIIKEFDIQSETAVFSAIRDVEVKIKEDRFPYFDYGTLVNYLIAIKYEVGIEFDLSSMENDILNNIKEKMEKLPYGVSFEQTYMLHDPQAKNVFSDFKKAIEDIFKVNDKVSNFDYNINNIDVLYDMEEELINSVRLGKGFAQKIDVEKFINLLKECSSKQLSKMRNFFFRIYPVELKNILTDEERIVLKTMWIKIGELKDYDKYDLIQKCQISWFYESLKELLK